MSGVVAVIDYGMGNLHSVASALAHAGARSRWSLPTMPILFTTPIAWCSPAWAPFATAWRRFAGSGATSCWREVTGGPAKPVLAICVGMQALMSHSQENGGVPCLDIIPGEVRYFGNPLVDSAGERLKYRTWGGTRCASAPAPTVAGY